MLLKIVLVFILTNCSVYSFTSSKYGPFDLTVKKFQNCRGPMRKDCAVMSARIINETILLFDMVIKENVSDVHGSMYATSVETKQTVKLQMKKICNHPFWRPFMETFLKFNKCYILQGNYEVAVNVQDLARSYYGGSFIYGRWTFKSVLYSNDCNFSCMTVDMVLTPKLKKT